MALDPRHTLAHNQLGIASAMAGDISVARDHFRAAVEADDENAEALFNLARALDQTGSPAPARRHYERFLEVAGLEYAEQVSLAHQRLRENR